MAYRRGSGHPSAGSQGGNDGRGGYSPPSGGRDANDRGNGDGRARFAAEQAQRLREQAVAAQQAQASQQAAVAQATANRNMQAQIAAAEQQAAQQAAQKKQQAEQQAAQKKQQQQQQNQQGIASYKAMMEAPASVDTRTAPTQFTQGRSGTSYYPENAPDTMFRGLMGNLTGGSLLSGAANLVGEDNPVSDFLKAYSEFDPLGDFAQQSVYGMNDVAKQEYMRQEASNPNWPMMSEKERVQLARKPQMDNQLSNAFINNETGNTANDAQLNAMRPENMSEAQFLMLPTEMKRSLTQSNQQGAGDSNNPFLPPVIPPIEEVIPESYASYMTDYSPMFSFAGKSGLSSFAEGGVVKSQGIGRLFEDINR